MNENAVVVRQEITEEKITKFLDSLGPTKDLLPEEKKMFINIAKEFGLNPFKREIHITAYGKGEYRKCSIITGYEVYLKRAERTGKMNGWKCWTEGSGNDLKAVVQIYRKDQEYPFTHEAYYVECYQKTKEGNPNAIWAKMPRFMTKKVAIGQAFRLCFPDDLGGMPYVEEELPNEEPRNVTEPLPNDNDVSPPANTKPPEKEAARNGNNNPAGKASPHNTPADDSNSVLSAIAEIMNSMSPDGTPFFTEAEKKQERALIKGDAGIEALKNQQNRLAKEFKKRKAEYKPIPFGDEPVPAMYDEPETAAETAEAGDDSFEDDIPWGKGNSQAGADSPELEIF